MVVPEFFRYHAEKTIYQKVEMASEASLQPHLTCQANGESLAKNDDFYLSAPLHLSAES